MVISIITGYYRFTGEIYTKKSIREKISKNWEGEISLLNKAESIFYDMDPSANPIANYRGLAKIKINRTEEALEDFKKAHKVHPNHLLVLINIAACYERLGDTEKTENYLKRALNISPRFELALLNLTALYYKKGDFEKALETITQCNLKKPKVAYYYQAIQQKRKKFSQRVKE